jgi:tRNA nucleotidyltransferase (CCA-adding enzyme)
MKNKLKTLSPELRKILKVACVKAAALKFKIYLVGGVARDLILGESTFDLDIVVEGDAVALAIDVAKHFKKDFKKHHAFGTATVYFDEHKIDFATARSEHYPHWGALPKVTPSSLKDDLLRRDFTINAMAIGLNKDDYGKLIDFYGGAGDLGKRLIKVLHEKSFLEDPTRILRAIRFEKRFPFKLDKGTKQLMTEALKLEALTFVHPHRLSTELILILKEPKPYPYIKRLYQVTGFSFVDGRIKLTDKDFDLFKRVERTIKIYKQKIKGHKKIEEWLIYLAAILINFSQPQILNFFKKFGLRKVDMIRILAMKENLSKVKKLDKEVKPHVIYHLLNPLSYESILFFYAYYPRKKLRKNIECFLDELAHMHLKVKGEDLKKMELAPLELYSRLLQRLLYATIDKGLETKEDEIREAKLIFRRLAKNKRLVKKRKRHKKY